MALQHPVNAGDLRHKVRLEARTLGKDTLGGHTSAWALVAELWAAKRQTKPGPAGGEPDLTKAAGGPTPVAQVEWVIRHRAGLNASQHRVVHGADVYNITHTNNLREQNQFVVLTCELGADRG